VHAADDDDLPGVAIHRAVLGDPDRFMAELLRDETT